MENATDLLFKIKVWAELMETQNDIRINDLMAFLNILNRLVTVRYGGIRLSLLPPVMGRGAGGGPSAVPLHLLAQRIL